LKKILQKIFTLVFFSENDFTPYKLINQAIYSMYVGPLILNMGVRGWGLPFMFDNVVVPLYAMGY